MAPPRPSNAAKKPSGAGYSYLLDPLEHPSMCLTRPSILIIFCF